MREHAIESAALAHASERPAGPFGVRPSCFGGFPRGGDPSANARAASSRSARRARISTQRAETHRLPNKKEEQQWTRK